MHHAHRAIRSLSTLLLALLLACPVIAAAQTRSATETRNHALVADAFDAWARGDGQVFDLLAADVVWTKRP